MSELPGNVLLFCFFDFLFSFSVILCGPLW